MKRFTLRNYGWMASASALLFSGCAAFNPQNHLTTLEKSHGWKLLFDGTHTDAWRGYAETNFPAQGWVVEAGTLKNVGKGHGGDLVTKETYENFDLKFEWRISNGGNSGVKYEVLPEKSGHAGVGFEYQILDDKANADAANGPSHQTAALYALIPANEQKYVKPVGEWNMSEIIVRGQHGEHWLNGRRVVSYDMGSAELADAIAKSKFKKMADFGQKHATVLLLQDHGDTVWFRNLKVRRLSP